MRQVTITKGNQYDHNGYSINDGTLWGYGSIAERMDGTIGITRDGSLHINTPEINAAISATLVDGLMRMVTITDGSSPIAVDDGPALAEGPGICSKCHSYCDGDCDND